MADSAKETWGSGDAYEQYVGRWSRPVAREFLEWLNVEPGLRWGDVGLWDGRSHGMHSRRLRSDLDHCY